MKKINWGTHTTRAKTWVISTISLFHSNKNIRFPIKKYFGGLCLTPALSYIWVDEQGFFKERLLITYFQIYITSHYG